MSPLRRTKIKIGELLLQKGLITSQQLEEALVLQQTQEKDKLLGQILIERGYVDRDELHLILAIQSGYPYVEISNCVIENELLSLIPKTFAEKYQVFPIDKIQDILTVAMVNPLDKIAVAEIQKLSECRVMAFLTTTVELKHMISRHYGQK